MENNNLIPSSIASVTSAAVHKTLSDALIHDNPSHHSQSGVLGSMHTHNNEMVTSTSTSTTTAPKYPKMEFEQWPHSHPTESDNPSAMNTSFLHPLYQHYLSYFQSLPGFTNEYSAHSSSAANPYYHPSQTPAAPHHSHHPHPWMAPPLPPAVSPAISPAAANRVPMWPTSLSAAAAAASSNYLSNYLHSRHLAAAAAAAACAAAMDAAMSKRYSTTGVTGDESIPAMMPPHDTDTPFMNGWFDPTSPTAQLSLNSNSRHHRSMKDELSHSALQSQSSSNSGDDHSQSNLFPPILSNPNLCGPGFTHPSMAAAATTVAATPIIRPQSPSAMPITQHSQFNHRSSIKAEQLQSLQSKRNHRSAHRNNRKRKLNQLMDDEYVVENVGETVENEGYSSDDNNSDSDFDLDAAILLHSTSSSTPNSKQSKRKLKKTFRKVSPSLSPHYVAKKSQKLEKGMSVTKSDSLAELMHTIVSTDSHTCIDCNKKFKQKCHLLRHVREKHLLKPPAYPCPVCTKTFSQKTNLDTHVLTHSNSRDLSHPFRCITCVSMGIERKFTRKSSLKRHVQSKHPNVDLTVGWINDQKMNRIDAQMGSDEPHLSNMKSEQ